ncbi:hypothetical protein [Synechococcus sp. CCY 9618]|uniref:hypothetical protein n=1 Tax=Synechococcus sp. CCY 9618 TaxID=2815602 RepID=UPI001C234C20|nr:hypothetical protein [Synechococcus sp. CCY 9618]
MTSTIIEMILGYGFVMVLFVGLPAMLFLVVFLPGLMRTTGETIGSSEASLPARPVLSRTVPTRCAPARPMALTMANTA